MSDQRFRLVMTIPDEKAFEAVVRELHELGYQTWSWGRDGNGFAYIEGSKRADEKEKDYGKMDESRCLLCGTALPADGR